MRELDSLLALFERKDVLVILYFSVTAEYIARILVGIQADEETNLPAYAHSRGWCGYRASD